MKFTKIFYFKLLLLCFFLLGFFVPRYFASANYDALEDEILALGNNMMYSTLQLARAPDFTHPPFWYVVMDLPVFLLGLHNGIFYYRLIQVVLLFFLITITFLIFKRIRFTEKSIFISLFLTNIYLVHLTFQNRMYALVIGLSIFYLFFWDDCFRNYQKEKNYLAFIGLGLVAGLTFLTNYSFIWLLPIWPLVFVFAYKGKQLNGKFYIFAVSFLVSISWFIPYFFKNALHSIDVNQWAPEFTVFHITELVGTYFGFVPMNLDLYRINPLLYIFLLFVLYIFYRILSLKNNQALKLFLIFTFLSFFFFLFIAKQSGNSLLYARTSITLVLAFYFLFTKFLITINDLLVKYFLLFSLLFLQLSQFVIYYFPTENMQSNYNLFSNYKINPISYFKKYPFPDNSCLLTIPNWNATAASYFLHDHVKVIRNNYLANSEVVKEIQECPMSYILEQSSVDSSILKSEYERFLPDKFPLKMVDYYENQNLYQILVK